MPQNRTRCWYFVGITTANASPHIPQLIDSVAACFADGVCDPRRGRGVEPDDLATVSFSAYGHRREVPFDCHATDAQSKVPLLSRETGGGRAAGGCTADRSRRVARLRFETCVGSTVGWQYCASVVITQVAHLLVPPVA